MKPIALNTYDFEQLRTTGFIYVDKTAYLHRLVTAGNNLFFIARPRRFGKSLMISTFKYIFQGRRELFQGLAIDKTDYDWQTYPILHFDFSLVQTQTLAAFEADFKAFVLSRLQDAGAHIDPSQSPGWNFDRALKELKEKQNKPVVVLIDEYDSPIGHALDDPAKADAIRRDLAAFYIQIKGNVEKVRFLMITGVTKFAQLSVISALSNLTDLTFSPDYATMFGYTEEELGAAFADHLRACARAMGLPDPDFRAEFKRWYNGYRFSKYNPKSVYNPVSVANALATKYPNLAAYWSQTGRASVLLNYLGRGELLSRDYERIAGVPESRFDSCKISQVPSIALLYQTGYLTIKDYDPLTGYTLGVPDEEVRRDLNTLLTSAVMENDDTAFRDDTCHALLTADFELFFENLKTFYARVPYGTTEVRPCEASYQRLLFVLLTAYGLRVTAEDRQAAGRPDLVCDTPVGIYLFELKVDAPAAAALAQIKEKDYAAPYRARKLPVYAIGLGFSTHGKALADTAAERL